MGEAGSVTHGLGVGEGAHVERIPTSAARTLNVGHGGHVPPGGDGAPGQAGAGYEGAAVGAGVSVMLAAGPAYT